MDPIFFVFFGYKKASLGTFLQGTPNSSPYGQLIDNKKLPVILCWTLANNNLEHGLWSMGSLIKAIGTTSERATNPQKQASRSGWPLNEMWYFVILDSEKYHSPGANPSLNAFVLAESIGMKGNAANVKNKSLSELLRLGGGSGQMRPGFAESACKDTSTQRSRGSAWLAKLGKKKPLSRSNMPDRHVLFTVCVRRVRKRRRAMAAVPGKRKTSFHRRNVEAKACGRPVLCMLREESQWLMVVCCLRLQETSAGISGEPHYL